MNVRIMMVTEAITNVKRPLRDGDMCWMQDLKKVCHECVTNEGIALKEVKHVDNMEYWADDECHHCSVCGELYGGKEGY